MKNILLSTIVGLFVLVSCQSNKKEAKNDTTSLPKKVEKVIPKKVMSSAEAILLKPEVPILCYHRIRNILASDGANMKTYSVTPTAFAEQMKALSDGGYHTILPEQLYDYLVYDGKLPSKPVMITFDDTREEQYSIGAAEMKKYDFKAAFFIMTISIHKPKYMTKEQIKELSDNGNTIGTHSWDHHMVTKYVAEDWETQLVKPKKLVESIIGKPATYFAYPDGVWNKAAIPEIKKAGNQLAFILSSKRDSVDPLFTVRRMIVSGTWTTPQVMKAMQSTFNK